jgi:transcriptional regulator with XRE-family HTH domain
MKLTREESDLMNVLKGARGKLDMTQQQACDLLNVALATYRNWEMKRTQPNASQIMDLHKQLDIPLDELMEHFKKEETK